MFVGLDYLIQRTLDSLMELQEAQPCIADLWLACGIMTMDLYIIMVH